MNTVDLMGMTALHSAVVRGHVTAVQLPLENGADVQMWDGDGRAALQLVEMTGDRRMAQLLVQHGVEINASSGDGSGRSPFHYAAILGHCAVVELFMQCFADLDARDARKMTVAQTAAASGYHGSVRLVLGTDDKGEIAMATAVRRVHASLVRVEMARARKEVRDLLLMDNIFDRFQRLKE